MKRENLAKYFDHTILKPDASPEQIEQICREAVEYGFASVCVNPVHVSRCKEFLQGSRIPVCSVVGFPLGSNTSGIKAAEAKQAVLDGAREVDMVLNITALKSGDAEFVEQDIRQVVTAADPALVKVIIEACLLTDQEKKIACGLAVKAGAHFVKTSTGFSSGGATVEDIALMRQMVGTGTGVKAAGGIKTLASAMKMIQAGATRIGASASVGIIRELDS